MTSTGFEGCEACRKVVTGVNRPSFTMRKEGKRIEASTKMLSFHTAMLLGFTPHRTLYPTTRALQTGTLPVTEPHKLYYEVHGKAGGAPALFLHGGPGAGCAVRHAGFFDPKHYQIVLFDQRGCGRSTPTGELQDNNAAELVQDCERLREHLGFDRWACVLGGSWGTTLALAYSGAHPDRVGSIVMRAVCLMRATEIRWLFGLGGGMSRLLPGTWYPLQQHWEKERATSTVAEDVALPEAPADELLCWYADALGGRLSDKAMSEASGAWGRYEMGVFGLSSRLPAHKLETLPGAERSTWVWEPQAQQWTAGAMVLPENEVREALVDRFEERMAASLLANGFVKQEDLTAAADRAAAAAAAAARAAAAAADVVFGRPELCIDDDHFLQRRLLDREAAEESTEERAERGELVVEVDALRAVVDDDRGGGGEPLSLCLRELVLTPRGRARA